MNLSRVLKKKRDAEDRLRQSSPPPIITSTGNGVPQVVDIAILAARVNKLKGGTAGQVLAKASDADFDFIWINLL